MGEGLRGEGKRQEEGDFQHSPAVSKYEGTQEPRPPRTRQAWEGVLMAAPALLLVALFTLYPVGRAVYQSTRIESPIFPFPFVGLENYRDVPAVSTSGAAGTTLWFALASVPLLIVLGVLWYCCSTNRSSATPSCASACSCPGPCQPRSPR